MFLKNKKMNKIATILLLTIIKVFFFASASYAGVRGNTIEIYIPTINNLESAKQNTISIEDGAIYLIPNNGEKILINASEQ